MKPLPYNFYKNNAIMNVLEYTIGNGNKFVFLDDKGDFYILNEKAGEWSEDGAWFSNTSYKRSAYSYYGKYSSYNDWADDWYEGYNKSVSSGKTKYKYNKDEFDVEEITNGTSGQNDYDYSICDGCNEWREVEDVKYSKEYHSYLCSGCQEMYEVDDARLIEEIREGLHD